MIIINKERGVVTFMSDKASEYSINQKIEEMKDDVLFYMALRGRYSTAPTYSLYSVTGSLIQIIVYTRGFYVGRAKAMRAYKEGSVLSNSLLLGDKVKKPTLFTAQFTG